MKEPIPQLARRGFDADTLRRRVPGHIIRVAIKLQTMCARQSGHELLVRVRFRPAQFVIEVNNRKDNPQLAAQLQQQPQQGDRINSAGNSNSNAIPSTQQLLPLNVGKQALR